MIVQALWEMGPRKAGVEAGRAGGLCCASSGEAVAGLGAGGVWNEADRLRRCFAGRSDLTVTQRFLYHLQ